MEILDLQGQQLAALRTAMAERLVRARVTAGTHDRADAEAVATRVVAATTGTGEVASPGRAVALRGPADQVGTAVLTLEPGGECFIKDLDCPPEGLRALEVLARESGCTVLRINVFAHEAELASAVAHFETSNIQMRLELAEAFPVGDIAVDLVPLSSREFDDFAAHGIVDYADDMVRARTAAPDAALRRSQEEFDEMLPDRERTEGHLLLRAHHGGEPIGWLWAEHDDQGLFVLDLVVDEAKRGQGLGRALVKACIALAQSKDARRLRLSVFGFNTVAIQLYEDLGFTRVEELKYLDLA